MHEIILYVELQKKEKKIVELSYFFPIA